MRNEITKKFFQFKSRIEEKLKQYCASLSPKKRLVSIMILCTIFGIASLYISFSAIYNINKTDRDQIKIEHINQLQLHVSDSIHKLNLKQYERN
jgi:hypothetical protein